MATCGGPEWVWACAVGWWGRGYCTAALSKCYSAGGGGHTWRRRASGVMWERKAGAGLTLWSSPPFHVRSERAAFSVLGRHGSGEWDAQKWRPCCISPQLENSGSEWRYFCPECSWFWEHGGKRQVDTPALSGATRHREKLPPGVFWTVVIEKEDTWASGAVWHTTSRQLSYLPRVPLTHSFTASRL